MPDTAGLDDLEAQIAALDSNLGAAADMAAAFNGEMGRVRLSFSGTQQDAARLERGIDRGLTRAIKGAVVEGDSLSTSLRSLASSMVNSAFNAAVRPVTDQLSGLVTNGIGALLGGLVPFEKGGSFVQGRVQPFARGGVVSGPTTFPMHSGTGLMGEAGPEAIMPLARGADGRLGVRGAGAGSRINVVINVSTPDVEGFRRSQAQIAAQLGRVIGRGNRNR